MLAAGEGDGRAGDRRRLDEISDRLAELGKAGALAERHGGALAREVGDDNICVNSIMPGLTISGSNQEGVMTPEQLADRRKRRCLQRDQYPQDLVGTVIFLASDDSDFMTGQSIGVDGGMNMH
jgi:enoyl-[acyl-carrier-protein] reductase (NADH)